MMSRSIEDKSTRDAVSELRRIGGELRGEAGSIQIQGRALNAKERDRIAALNKALALIEQAVEALEGGSRRK